MVENHHSRLPRSVKRRHRLVVGETSQASHGYVLVKQPDHARAFSNGYVYEHILVAEQKLGRPLLPKEEVHHDDENKQNNHPDNLIIEPSRAHHFLHHRAPDSKLRHPDEPNPLITCGCGCGRTLRRYDASGRPRLYVSGHNPSPSPTTDAILDAVKRGYITTEMLSDYLSFSAASIRTALSRMVNRGLIIRRDHGVYGLPGSPLLRQQETVLCACGCGLSLLRYDVYRRERRFISGHNARRRG